MPRLGGNGVGRGSDRKHVKDHQLAVMVPTRGDKALCASPTHREQIAVAIKHPREVNPAVDGIGKRRDLAVVREILASCKNAGNEQRRINGGEF